MANVKKIKRRRTKRTSIDDAFYEEFYSVPIVVKRDTKYIVN